MLEVIIFFGITIGCAVNLGSSLILDTRRSRTLEIVMYSLLTFGFMAATFYFIDQL